MESTVLEDSSRSESKPPAWALEEGSKRLILFASEQLGHLAYPSCLQNIWLLNMLLAKPPRTVCKQSQRQHLEGLRHGSEAGGRQGSTMHLGQPRGCAGKEGP